MKKNINKTLFFIFSLMNIVGINCHAQNPSIMGSWKVVKCLSDDYDEPELSKNEQERELGSKVVISNEEMILSFKNFQDTCKNPNITVKKNSTNSQFKGDTKLINWLGLKKDEMISTFNSSCDSYWFKQFFFSNDGRLIMRAEGFYYFLIKENENAIAKVTPKSEVIKYGN